MTSAMTAVWVAALGAAGSLCRWALGGAIQRAAGAGFPWGTFAVNALGSLAIGAVMALFLRRGSVGGMAHAAVVAGFLGGFTTMSAFAYDTVALLEQGDFVRALVYAGATVVVCVAACGVGLAVMRAALG
jgi:fluoride exporter